MRSALTRRRHRRSLVALGSVGLVIALIAIPPAFSGAKKKGPSKLQKQVRALTASVGALSGEVNGLRGRLDAVEGRPAPPKAVWAHISTNGTILGQSGGVSVTKGASGIYFVDLGVDLAGRGLSVTSGGQFFGITPVTRRCADNTDPGFCGPVGASPSAVDVRMWSTNTNQQVDDGFEIVATP